MNDVLITALSALTLIALFLTFAVHTALHVKLARRRAPELSDAELPAISVLKPLKGYDDELFENLASFAALDYPGLELVLGAEDPDDPALDVAQRLRRAFPEVRITVVSGAPPLGRNPKVNNLAMLARYARHDVLLISDSNVRVAPNYLRAIASELADPKVGLVSNLIAGTGEVSTGAVMENVHLGTFVAATVAAGDLLGHPLVVGKSMLIRRSALEAAGGFEGVRDVLAEDYVLGQRVHASGRRVVLSSFVIETVNVEWSVRRFLARHVRWAQLRRRLAPFTYAAEPVLNPIPLLLALLGLVALAKVGAVEATPPASLAGLALLGIAAKCASDARLVAKLRGTPLPLADLAWIPVKDVLVAGIWCVAFVRRKVTWRGNELYLGPGSVLLARDEPLAEASVHPDSAMRTTGRVSVRQP